MKCTQKGNRGRGLLFAALFVGILGGAIESGFADERLTPPDLGGLTSGGGVSNEEGVDQIKARVSDWQNDLDLMSKTIPSACAVSDLDRILLPSQPGAVISPEFAALAKMRPKLALSVPRVGGVAHPLQDALLLATAPITLTAAEKAERDLLRARVAESDAEVIGLEIEGQKFLIRVVNRIYDSAVAYSLQRVANDRSAGGVFGSMYANQDLCAADTIQSERDVALMSAANSILPLYDELAKTESDAASGAHSILR